MTNYTTFLIQKRIITHIRVRILGLLYIFTLVQNNNTPNVEWVSLLYCDLTVEHLRAFYHWFITHYTLNHREYMEMMIKHIRLHLDQHGQGILNIASAIKRHRLVRCFDIYVGKIKRVPARLLGRYFEKES